MSLQPGQTIGRKLRDWRAGLVRLRGWQADQKVNLLELGELMEDVVKVTTPVNSAPAHLKALL